MYNHFKAVSLTYHKTALEVRELIALDEELSKELILRLKDYEDISDILVISTCNRTEVYYASPINYNLNIIHEIFDLKKIDTHHHYQEHFRHIEDHFEAVEHLFSVSIGLDSQVVGDMQITNQIKKAYQMSADLDSAGPFLHRLLHTIFFTNKRVVQETAFRSGAASTSYAAVELIEQFASEIVNPKVLVLGLGEIGADLCRNLQGSFIQDISICNRTISKAEQLAVECNARVVPFENIQENIAEADIIISSIAASEPFISKDMIGEMKILSFKYFIDLSVPRSVAVEVEDLPGVLVYNIDKINLNASEALQKRLNSIPEVVAIIQQSLLDFHDWTKEMEISPAIQKLKNALEQIRMEELDRYSKKLSAEENLLIDRITKNMMQKIIKLPALQLKAACKRGEAETLIDVLNDLFNLENHTQEVI